MAQQDKLLFAMPASHIRVSVGVQAAVFHPPPANAPGEAAKTGPSMWALATHLST